MAKTGVVLVRQEAVALVWQSVSISPKTVVKNKIKHMKGKLLVCLIRNAEKM